jgi:hypothetical protein
VASSVLDPDDRDLARQSLCRNRGDVLQRVPDVHSLISHERAQRLYELKLVGEQLVGRNAVGAVHGCHSEAKDVTVTHVQAAIGAHDDDVAISHRHRRGGPGVVWAHDLLRTPRRDADRSSHAPSLANQRRLRVGDFDDPRPAGAAPIAADQAEAGLRFLENEDVGRRMCHRMGERTCVRCTPRRSGQSHRPKAMWGGPTAAMAKWSGPVRLGRK